MMEDSLSLWSLGNADVHLDDASTYLQTLLQSDLLAGKGVQ